GSIPTGNYTVTVDGNAATSQSIAPNGSVTFTSLTATSHSVALSGVPSSCTVTSANPQTVTVPAGGTATASFTVNCSTPPGNLTVSTSTSGTSQPSGYTVSLDGGSQTQSIAASGSVTFSNLAAGSHTVTLTNVAANCTVTSANPQTVTVPAGGTATASFTVNCSTPNSPPVVNAGPNETVVLGLLYSLNWSFSDVDNDSPWSYRIDWGDGSSTSGTTSSQGSFSTGHTYLLTGAYTVTVTVTDSGGASGSASKTVTVLLF
ncbi:MAG TPA: PKD domain-containing protein, partial [Gemmatimonadales bacterium]|nr:PKD domain-containing protein [Gemmatimonadales bacterium]